LFSASSPDGFFSALRLKKPPMLSHRAPHPKDKIFDSLSGFFAHEYFKSRALRAKNIAAFAYPYAQKPL